MHIYLKKTFALSLATLSIGLPVYSTTAIPLSEEKAIQENFTELAKEPGAVMFTPPEGWLLADPKALPPSIKVMVVGKGSYEYPPSMNLAIDTTSGNLKQYLKIVKEINDKMGAEWKDLGTIRTEAGDASLSQVDTKTVWGVERQMQVILVKNGTVYILTAAALKDEFPKFYKDFFNSMRSLRINKTSYEMISDSARRSNLEKAVAALNKSWKEVKSNSIGQHNNDYMTVFESDSFQKNHWIPFQNMLSKDYSDMGPIWKDNLSKKIKEEMLNL